MTKKKLLVLMEKRGHFLLFSLKFARVDEQQRKCNMDIIDLVTETCQWELARSLHKQKSLFN